MRCTSDNLIRSMRSDALGVSKIGVHGFGVEIIDGGIFDRENILAFGRSDRDTDASFALDNQVRCVPGTRVAAEFDFLQLTVPDPTIGDTVTVKIITTPLASWVDAEPTGKARVRWLSRGRVTIPPNTFQLIFDTATLGEADRFALFEQHDVFHQFAGWIAARKNFGVWVSALQLNVPASSYHVIHAFGARDAGGGGLPVLAGTPPQGAGWCCNFSENGAGSDLTPAPWPIGSLQFVVGNQEALNSTCEWCIGVRG